MGKLGVTIYGAQLFHRKQLLSLSEIPSTTVNINYDSDKNSFYNSKPATGFMPQYGETITIEGITSRSRLTISVICESNVIGHCQVSLRRLVQNKMRTHWFTLATPFDSKDGSRTQVAGYIQLGFLSSDIGLDPAGMTDKMISNVMQSEDYDIYCPRLTRILAVKQPAFLHIVDLILSEGEHIPFRVKEHFASLTYEEVADPSCSVASYFDYYLHQFNEISVNLSKNVSIAVKSGEELTGTSTEVLTISPKVVITSATQEMVTYPALNTNRPTYSGTERLFDALLGEKTIFQVTVVDHCPDGFEHLIGFSSFTLNSVPSERTSSRPVPLLNEENAYAGLITIDFYTDNVGRKVTDEEEMKTQQSYLRMINYFKKYDPPRLLQVDETLSSQGGADVDLIMKGLVAKYGLEPGSARVKIDLLLVESLLVNYRPVAVADVVVHFCLRASKVETRTVSYRNGKATFRETLYIDLERLNDIIEILVMDDDDKYVYGSAQISFLLLQQGVVKTRSFYLASDPGTPKSVVSGVITLNIFSENVGNQWELDDYYEDFYAKRMLQLFSSFYQENLHCIDVILSSVYDLEKYLTDLTPRSWRHKNQYEIINNEGTLSPIPTIKVTVYEGYKLDFPPEGATIFFQLGVDVIEGPVICEKNPIFEPFTAEFTVLSPEMMFILNLVSNKTDELIAQSVIPVKYLHRNYKFKKWFDLIKNFVDAKDEVSGEILLEIETIECGGEEKDLKEVSFFKLPSKNGHKPSTIVEPKISKDFKIEPFSKVDMANGSAKKLSPRFILDGEDKEVGLRDKPDEEHRLRATIEKKLEPERGVHLLDKDGNPVIEELNVVSVDQSTKIGETFNVNIVSVTSLTRNSKFEGNLSAYVKLRCREDKQRTKVVKGTGKEVVFNSKFNFTLPNPSRNDVLNVAVYNAEESGDYRYGACEIDITRIARGKTRHISVPIVKNPEFNDNTITGYITLTLHSKDWGNPEFPELSTNQKARIRNFLTKYCPELLHRLDFEYDAKEGFEVIMARNVKKFGPEPDTHELRISVINLEKLESNAGKYGGYRVNIQVGKEAFETKTIISPTPTYNETFNYNVSNKNKEIITLIVYYDNTEYGRCLMSLKNLPPNTIKRRTVSVVSNASTPNATCNGLCTLEFYAVDFGCLSIPSDEAERLLRSRIQAHLQRYAPQELHKVELLIGENVLHEEELMTNLIARYGCIPGDARLAVTIKDVGNLSRNSKAVLKGNIYVKVKTLMEKNRTKTIKNSSHPFFDETFTFDLTKPEKDLLYLSIFNDDFGFSDYKYGEVYISLGNLQMGVPRQITAMIVQNANTPEAVPNGFITIVLRSDDFGSQFPIDIEYEFVWRNRLKNFFLKHCPENLHLIDVVCSSQWDMPGYMSKMVKQYGPEPPSYELQLTIVNCKDLPDVRENASVDIINGFDVLTTRNVKPQGNLISFNETFTIFLTNPSTDQIIINVRDSENKKEHGQVVISARGVVFGVEKVINAFLVSNPGTKGAQIVGNVLIKMSALDFGISPTVALTPKAEVEARRSLEAAFALNEPEELHLMEPIIASLTAGRENQVLREIVSKYADTNHVPLTIRIRRFESLLKGTFFLKCTVGEQFIFKTKTFNLEGSEGAIFLDTASHLSSFVTALSNPASATIVFTLVEAKTITSNEVGVATMKVNKCYRDYFNRRKLVIFKKDDEVGKIDVGVRSVGFISEYREFDRVKWAEVEKDVVSLLRYYDPKSLDQLDNIAHEAENLDQLHNELLTKYNPRALFTLYMEDLTVEFEKLVGKELEKHNKSLNVLVTIGNLKDTSELVRVSSESKEGSTYSARDHEGDTRLSDTRSLPSTINSPRSTYRYAAKVNMLRFDFTKESLEDKNVRIKVQFILSLIGDVSITLLPLFASLIDVDVTQVIPIFGYIPGQDGKACVGNVRLSFSYPNLQEIPRFLIPRRRSGIAIDNTTLLTKNKAYINYFYIRIMEYLKEYSPDTARSFHIEYYTEVLNATDIKKKILSIYEKYISNIGAREISPMKPPAFVEIGW